MLKDVSPSSYTIADVSAAKRFSGEPLGVDRYADSTSRRRLQERRESCERVASVTR